MDHKGLIDFNKYTLTLAAGGFIYTLSKFVPVSEGGCRIGVLFILGFFLISMILGVLVFAAATASLHGDKNREASLKCPISWMGGLHAVCLVIGLGLLGVKLYSLVMSSPNQDKNNCYLVVEPPVTEQCGSLVSASEIKCICVLAAKLSTP